MLQSLIFSKTIIILHTANLFMVVAYIFFYKLIYASDFFFNQSDVFQLSSFMFYFLTIEILSVKLITLEQQVHLKNEKYNFPQLHILYEWYEDCQPWSMDMCVTELFLTFDRYPRGKQIIKSGLLHCFSQ